MPPSALLRLAAELLRKLLRFDAPADAVVAAFFREHHALGSRERATLADTAYRVLRERLLFEHLAASGSGPFERRLAMLAWGGNPASLDAALEPRERVWVEEQRAADRDALSESLRHNLPEWLAEKLRIQLGSRFWPLADSLNGPAPLDLRVNVLKARRDRVQAALREAGIEATPTPHSPWGLRVQGKPALGRLDAFKRGEVEVQDEGSQVLAALVDARRGETVVDFCAGSGGKTLALGAAMRDTGRLYAFDTSAHRLDALKPRLERAGLTNVYPMAVAHERDERIERIAGKVDRVLVDAPCSGLGTLRRNPDLKWRHSARSIEEFQSRQQAILQAAARLPKLGGRLVYATCSLLADENEVVARRFAAGNPSYEVVPARSALERAQLVSAGNLVEGDALRLWPHLHSTDGFFAMVWRRVS